METSYRKIGIAITTRNRRNIADITISQWQRFAPKNSIIAIVDDASDIPYPGATLRFDTQQGIAKSKNACIYLLLNAGCTDIFLSDDDTYPINHIGINQYLDSGFNHMCMSFDHTANGKRISNDVYIDWKQPRWWSFNSPCGCLLYFKSKVFDHTIGYDESFNIWGMEHKDLSLRIHKEGLTPLPYLDIPHSTDNFYSHDYHLTANSSVPENIRVSEIKRNIEYFNNKHS
ncbi:MAG: hypothetical protein LBF27_25865 [Sphingobacterium sp.]|jgi:hypothetical protein|nr:hypothetical protein [Sphingobacterium sp.]